MIILCFVTDEKNCSQRKHCEKNSPCQQQCLVTADGRDSCGCYLGYTLDSDGVT